MTTLNNFLPRFREIVSAKRDWLAMIADLQEWVAEEILRMGLAEDVDVYGLIEAIPFIVQDTHTRFRRCVDLRPPPERILCAPISVKDNVISLGRSSHFFRWACWKQARPDQPFEQFQQALGRGEDAAVAAHAQFIEAVLQRAADSAIETNACDLVDVAAAIIRSFPTDKKGLKPWLRRSVDAHLQEYIQDALQAGPAAGLFREVLGGASAIIADVMAELHQRDVWIYTTYNSPPQSQLFEAFARWWDPLRGPTGDLVRESGQADHPIRQSYILEFDQGLTLSDPVGTPICDAHGKAIQAQQKDRVIFRVPHLWPRAICMGKPGRASSWRMYTATGVQRWTQA
jgi:hypothetical protein